MSGWLPSTPVSRTPTFTRLSPGCTVRARFDRTIDRPHSWPSSGSMPTAARCFFARDSPVLGVLLPDPLVGGPVGRLADHADAARVHHVGRRGQPLGEAVLGSGRGDQSDRGVAPLDLPPAALIAASACCTATPSRASTLYSTVLPDSSGCAVAGRHRHDRQPGDHRYGQQRRYRPASHAISSSLEPPRPPCCRARLIFPQRSGARWNAHRRASPVRARFRRRSLLPANRLVQYRHPDGGSSGLGTSPARRTMSRRPRAVGSATGTAGATPGCGNAWGGRRNRGRSVAHFRVKHDEESIRTAHQPLRTSSSSK